MILFLDFDGVLHPNDVYLVDEQPVMGNTEGHEGHDSLLCFAPLLAEALQNRPDVKIVLSTSWVPYLGFDRAQSYLPATLQARVIGSTWLDRSEYMRSGWMKLMRYCRIHQYLEQFGVDEWCALDDDANGWPDDLKHRLIWCEDDYRGITDERVHARLREALG